MRHFAVVFVFLTSILAIPAHAWQFDKWNAHMKLVTGEPAVGEISLTTPARCGRMNHAGIALRPGELIEMTIWLASPVNMVRYPPIVDFGTEFRDSFAMAYPPNTINAKGLVGAFFGYGKGGSSGQFYRGQVGIVNLQFDGQFNQPMPVTGVIGQFFGIDGCKVEINANLEFME